MFEMFPTVGQMVMKAARGMCVCECGCVLEFWMHISQPLSQ